MIDQKRGTWWATDPVKGKKGFATEKEAEVLPLLPKKYKLVSKVLAGDVADLTVEVAASFDMHELTKALQPTVNEVSVLCYQGNHIPS